MGASPAGAARSLNLFFAVEICHATGPSEGWPH